MSEVILSVFGGLCLVAGTFIAYMGTRGKTRSDAKAAADARIDGRMDAELARIYARVDSLEAELTTVHKRLDDAESLIVVGGRQQVEMIQHIVHLEALIPNPPGPPIRPNWKLPILDGKGSQ